VYRNWNVTGVVAGWVAGSYANHGMWIEEIPVAGSGIAYFSSSDEVQAQRPILTVDYTEGQGVIPEPSTFIVWSLLGGLGIIGWWRRRGRAA
jgi:hypothetical protein